MAATIINARGLLSQVSGRRPVFLAWLGLYDLSDIMHDTSDILGQNVWHG